MRINVWDQFGGHFWHWGGSQYVAELENWLDMAFGETNKSKSCSILWPSHYSIKLRRVIMNYHEKIGPSSLKIDSFILKFSFWRPFCFMATILFWVSHFVFWQKKLRRVIMNYHEKIGPSSLKIDWVMLNSVFGGHFVFGGLFFGKKKLGRDIMNYHAKSQGSSLKIDRVMALPKFCLMTYYWI